MKKILIIFVLSLFFSSSYAQKHDYTWVMGDSFSKKIIFDFNVSPIQISSFTNNNIGFGPDIGSLSDSLGNLQAMATGMRVFNKNRELMENGDSINYGPFYEISILNIGYATGYIGFYGNLFLPMPSEPNEYLYIHTRFHRDSFLDNVAELLQYSIVDMNANGGLGKVKDKNTPLVAGRIGWPTACKHGNGRDWWILTYDLESTKHYRFLLSDRGIEGPFTQHIGPEWTDFEGANQSSFSPDGKTYIRHDGVSGLRIYDFDRCTGELSNLRIVPYVNGFWTHALAFSEDMKYLYLGDRFKIYQIDLSLHEPFAHIETIQDFSYSLSVNSFSPAPDGKIYILPYYPPHIVFKGSINHPSQPSLSADVSYFPLPTYGADGIPHFPNYRLGEWEGAVCDTINLQQVGDGFYKSHYIPNEIVPDKDKNNFSYLSPIIGTNDPKTRQEMLKYRNMSSILEDYAEEKNEFLKNKKDEN